MYQAATLQSRCRFLCIWGLNSGCHRGDFHVQDNELESHIVDAPRNVKARAEQEAKWAGDYDGRQHWSLREAYLKHRARLQGAQRDLYRYFLLLDAHFLSQSSCLKDQAYDSSVSDSEFYADAVRPLVASLTGAEATIICYGQTGTGKTHTFNACWKRIGNDLAGCTISVTFFEIHGKKCPLAAADHTVKVSDS
eukprot:g29746.t1